MVAVALDDRPFLREVEGDDLEVLAADILPDVLLRPVRQREDADALALVDLRVVELPHLWALVLRIPRLRRIAEREDALLGARFLLVAAAVKLYFVRACLSACVFMISVYEAP